MAPFDARGDAAGALDVIVFLRSERNAHFRK